MSFVRTLEVYMSFDSIPLEEERSPVEPMVPRQMQKSPITQYSSKNMLLRLFQSELFTCTQAVYYLYKYASDPGIQFYLCERLKDMPYHKVEFLLPQLCHLMVMHTHESAPIENFMVHFTGQHLHASIQVLWILENYLNDLRSIQKNSLHYIRAARILTLIQRAVFREEMSDKSRHATKKALIRALDQLKTYYGTEPARCKFMLTGPAIVGFGAMLAALACPQDVKQIKPLIMMQARKADPFNLFLSNSEHRSLFNKQSNSPPSQASSPALSEPVSSPRLSSSDTSGPSLEELSRGKAFSFKRYLSKTAKNLLTNKSTSSITLSSDFEQLSFKSTKQTTNLSPTLFPTIPLFYHQEMHFVSSLIAVSERLKSISNRSSCLKALHAELCLINHNLPASLCIPSWCREHHRVLSVLPYESSVLNSAERVPYIAFIEVFYGVDDVEFDRIVSEKHTSPDLDEELSQDSEDVDSSTSGNAQILALAEGQAEEKIATSSGMIDVTERMRTAAVMLAQLARQTTVPNADLNAINTIRSRIIHEMEQLERDRLIDILQNAGKLSKLPSKDELFDEKAAEIHPVIDKRDPSAAIFKEDWQAKKRRIAKSSPYSGHAGWDVIPVIVKSSTDMRQEHLAYQLVSEVKDIFAEASLDIFLKPCKVLVASNYGGLIEVVPNSISVHSIKKSILLGLEAGQVRQELLSLKYHYIQQHGMPGSDEFERASRNFLRSLVGYSLLTYLLQIRDRHNGNILIDRDGHVVHIDFGFMLSNSPGYVGFESAPFKLTSDYLEMLDGMGSEKWFMFKRLFLQGLLAIRKHSDRLMTLLELMMKDSTLPCFHAGEAALMQFKERLHLSLTENQIEQLVDKLMTTSALNVFTRLYDSYQYYTNGIL